MLSRADLGIHNSAYYCYITSTLHCVIFVVVYIGAICIIPICNNVLNLRAIQQRKIRCSIFSFLLVFLISYVMLHLAKCNISLIYGFSQIVTNEPLTVLVRISHTESYASSTSCNFIIFSYLAPITIARENLAI